MLVVAGEFARAEELAVEEAALTWATAAAPMPYAWLALAASRGRRAEITELQAATAQEAAGPPTGTEVSWTQYALAVLHNGVGEYPAALDAAARACDTDELPHSNSALPELIEAAVRAVLLVDAVVAAVLGAPRAVARADEQVLHQPLEVEGVHLQQIAAHRDRRALRPP